jgi:hypothetical protein
MKSVFPKYVGKYLGPNLLLFSRKSNQISGLLMRTNFVKSLQRQGKLSNIL